MTVQLIRLTAKEFAGAFYEQKERTPQFRRAFPTLRDFLAGRAHALDGTIRKVEPGWHHFLDAARYQLGNILAQPNTHQHLKDAIYDALIEQSERGMRPGAKQVLQTNLDKRDDQRAAYSPDIRG